MKNDFISPQVENNETLKNANIKKRFKTVGIAFVFIGLLLFSLGIIILFVKGKSTLTIISLPVIFLGILIAYNSKGVSSTID